MKTALERYEAFDHYRAQGEGWSIFHCEGSANGEYQLQKVDEAELFKDDSDAIKWVAELAYTGSEFHMEALRLCVELNPEERRYHVEAIGNASIARKVYGASAAISHS